MTWSFADKGEINKKHLHHEYTVSEVKKSARFKC